MSFPVLLLILVSACQNTIYVEQEDGGDDPDAGLRRDSAASGDRSLPPPAALDGGVPAQDAAGQQDASCGPGSGVYPCGPFGTSAGQVIANESLWGYYDTDRDGLVIDESGGSFDLARYYLLSASGSKLLYINVSAPWCSTCQEEAGRLRSLYQEFHGRGVEFLTVMWDLGSGSQAKEWASYFDLPFAVADDTGPQRFAKYWDGSGVPMGMFIELRTMKILSIFVDWDESHFRAKVNGYLAGM